MSEEVENNTPEYFFQVGSLKFKSFKELYLSIEGRSDAFSKQCAIVCNDNVVMAFNLTYEKSLAVGQHRFVFEWAPQQRVRFNTNADMVNQLNHQLPKFKLVGSTANMGGMGVPQKLYGYLNVADLK